MSTAEATIVEVASADAGVRAPQIRAAARRVPAPALLALIVGVQLAWLGALAWGAVALFA